MDEETKSILTEFLSDPRKARAFGRVEGIYDVAALIRDKAKRAKEGANATLLYNLAKEVEAL